MSALTVDCRVRYEYPSRLSSGQLLLATSTVSPQAVAPHFFTGRLVRPLRTAGLLRALMSIVRTRFHVPAAMLSRILAEADPVVTSSDDRIRFEGFSACCGVYARVDMLPASVEGQTFGRGTTNVDFNQPMLTALAKIRRGDRVQLNVGVDHVELSRNFESVLEKKVALPIRWLKGFVEVQSCQSRMTPVHDVSGLEAARFLRSMPRMKTNRRETFIVGSGQGLRTSQIATRLAVRVGGLERIRVLEGIIADAQRMRIYADETTGASAWELTYPDCRFHLVISPEVWRGFSGEGQALNSMASTQWAKILTLVRKQLAWKAVIDEEALHRCLAATSPDLLIDAQMIRGALSALGTHGLVGYDLAEGCWFHRELPFDFDAVEKQHPRLKDARKLLAEDKVRLGQRLPHRIEVFVLSGGVEQLVRLLAEGPKCTCTWFAKHGSTRGPCKHILASQLFVEGIEDDQ